MFREKEFFGFGTVEHLQKRVIITVHVEQPDRLLMFADLRPGKRLEEFIQSAITTRKSYIAVRQGVHTSLTLVDGLRHLQTGQMGMGQFRRIHTLGDYSDDLPATRQHTICQRTHQSGLAATVDEGQSASSKSSHPSDGLLQNISRKLAGQSHNIHKWIS